MFFCAPKRALIEQPFESTASPFGVSGHWSNVFSIPSSLSESIPKAVTLN
jgi:hypothetical protein